MKSFYFAFLYFYFLKMFSLLSRESCFRLSLSLFWKNTLLLQHNMLFLSRKRGTNNAEAILLPLRGVALTISFISQSPVLLSGRQIGG